MDPTIYILLLFEQATRNLILQGQIMERFGTDYVKNRTDTSHNLFSTQPERDIYNLKRGSIFGWHQQYGDTVSFEVTALGIYIIKCG